MFNFLLLFFFPLLALADASPPGWQASVEVCPGLRDSFADTRSAALDEARREILLQAGEVWVSAQTLTQASVVQADWLQLYSKGVLSQEKVLKEGWLPARSPHPPCYFLHLQAQVKYLPSPSAAGLDVKLWLDLTELQAGMPVELKLLSASGGYLTLLNVSADGSVTLLLPNARHPQPFYLPPGQLHVFPSLLGQADLQFVARVLPGQASSRELLKGIVTRQPLQLQSDLFKQGLFQVYDRFGTGLYSDLQRLLLALEPGSWNEGSFVYRISGEVP